MDAVGFFIGIFDAKDIQALRDQLSQSIWAVKRPRTSPSGSKIWSSSTAAVLVRRSVA
jgi:hypothetical protein